MTSEQLKRVAFLGNYLPRHCGIATFMTDLCEAVAQVNANLECFAVAMNDRPEGHEYPPRVRMEIDQERREEYDLAADFIVVNQPDVLCVQHEYGIFGGRAGRYLIPLLRQVRTPVVTTLHTVLAEPNQDQRKVLLDLAEISDRLVVMSPRMVEYLKTIYHVPEGKIRLIHHGIPDMPFVDSAYFKDQFGVEGRTVLLTFGLLSPNKGVENVLHALPRIAKAFPNVVYIIVGETHPHVRREQGESYRIGLQQVVHELGLESQVVFVNRFVELAELCEYLGCADIYLTPYLDPAQAVSGTLAYAMGTGKAVVSTPYWYAEDMLTEGRGCIVPFRDPNAIADTVLNLLQNEVERHAMRKRAYTYGRTMIWKEVAARYVELMAEVREERLRKPRPVHGARLPLDRFEALPELNPRHLLKLTDDVGILQHAKFSVPDRHFGYSTDDQARALVVAVKGGAQYPDAADWVSLEGRYLAFLNYAFDSESRRFTNFLDYGREWVKPVPTEDVHARAVWALAQTVAHSGNAGHRGLAMHLLESAIEPVLSFNSPRAWASTILGIQEYLRRFSGATAFRRERDELARRLVRHFEDNMSDDWPWPENRLVYANARLPQALIEAGQWLPDSRMVEVGLRALGWLDTIQTASEGHFVPVGSNGWFPRGGEQARFDQQPIEAYTMLDACLAAYRTTRDRRWLISGRRAFDWFLGRNDLRVSLYDDATGACHDGLHRDRVNQNQGAESTIVWLLALLAMDELQDEIATSSG
jgi:glycosyltransferase involved in cell wall biosynthesis